MLTSDARSSHRSAKVEQTESGSQTGVLSIVPRVGICSHVTATKYSIPNEATLNFGQIQNIATSGEDVFIAVAPIGAEGNIYVFNSKTGAMTVGAKLLNKPGNQYIGVY